jgi:putative ABC transport system ATP-binding protein
MGRQAVSISDLHFRYAEGAFALDIPHLSIPEGQHAALTGASGCGKTTLVSLISGIAIPQAGCVEVGDQVISRMDDRRRRDFRISNIGFIFQEFELIDYLRTEENILLPYLVNRSLPLTQEVRNAARELALSVGLGRALKRSPRELSHGERQRVAICRALITQPRLLIADEPTATLDAGNTQTIMDLISKHLSGRNTTFLMITHEHELLSTFDRVIDMPALAKGGAI